MCVFAMNSATPIQGEGIHACPLGKQCHNVIRTPLQTLMPEVLAYGNRNEHNILMGPTRSKSLMKQGNPRVL